MTSPKNLKIKKTPRDYESLFLDHYGWLLKRARHLASGTSEDPQDLVQELYISFIHLNASHQFSDEAHVRAYLRKALKNLFALRRMRHGTDATTRLALVDFDSVEFGLTAIDRSRLLHVRSDLAKIGEYVLARRHSSKGATVFLMRFFFGYLPSEIMSLLKLNRKAFEKMLLTTRLEAKAYIERPHVLRFLLRQEANAPEFPKHLPEESEALFAELQRRMFFLPVGAHTPLEQLEQIYSTSTGSLSLEQTAHLGSCRTCLQRAGDVLHIPDLLLQLFPDPAEPGDPTSSSRGLENDPLKKLRRRGREVFEHRPSKLQIIVDGQLRGVQTVTGVESRLQLTLKPFSKPEFVEIRSEQGVLMLYFDLEEGAELLEDREVHADFSEGRRLTASFCFADGTSVIDVFYFDPLMELPDEGDSLDWTPVIPQSGEPRDTTESESLRSTLRRWFSHRLSFLPSKWEVIAADSPSVPAQAKRTVRLGEELALDVVAERSGTVSQIPAEQRLPSSDPLLDGASQQSRWRKLVEWFHSNPAPTAVGAVCSIGMLLVWLFGTRSPGKPTAETVLEHSIQAEAVNSDLPSHQVLAFEEVTSNGQILHSGRVETTREKGRLSQRFYDPTGRQLSEQILDHSPSTHDCLEEMAEWSCDLSAKQLKDVQGNLTLAEQGDDYRLSYTSKEAFSSTASPRLVRAELILDQRSLHAKEQHLWVDRGDAIREYLYREIQYEVGNGAPSPGQQKLHPQSLKLRRRQGQGGSLPHLLLVATQTLRTLGGDADLSLTVQRKGSDSLLIAGSLSSKTEALAARRALASLTAEGSVLLNIHSMDEERMRAAGTLLTTIALTAYEVNAAAAPAEDQLRQYFRQQGSSGPRLDREVHLFTEAALGDVASAHRDAWRLQRLSTLLTPADVVSLNAADRQVWLAMLGDSLHTLESDLTRLDQQLGNLPFPSKQTHDKLPTGHSLEDQPYLERIAEIVQRTMHTERDLTSALTVRAGAQNKSVPKLEDTYQQLKIAESLLSDLESQVASYAREQ